jgi:flagellar hook-length control protein FliK
MPDSNAEAVSPTIAPRVAVPERANSIASSVPEPTRAGTGYSTERLPPIPSTASTSTTKPKQTSSANNSEARQIKSQDPRSIPADSAADRVARKAEPQTGAASRAGERELETKPAPPTTRDAVRKQAERLEFAAADKQTRTVSPQQIGNTTSATSAVLDHASETPSPLPATSAAPTDPSPAVPTPSNVMPATIAAPIVAATVTAKPEASPLSNPDAVTPSQSSVPGVHADLGALAVKIAAKSREGDRHFDIRLDPPELGRIDVHLFVDQSGRAQAHLSADKPHTLELLQRDSADLQRGLKDAGLELSNSGLNFSLKGQEQRDGTPQFMPRPRPATPALAEASAAARPSPATSYASNARLDIRV